MLIKLPKPVQDDVEASVRARLSESVFMNVAITAEAIRKRHEEQNVALEDIVALLTLKASQFGRAVELGRPPASDSGQHAGSA